MLSKRSKDIDVLVSQKKFDEAYKAINQLIAEVGTHRFLLLKKFHISVLSGNRKRAFEDYLEFTKFYPEQVNGLDIEAIRGYIYNIDSFAKEERIKNIAFLFDVKSPFVVDNLRKIKSEEWSNLKIYLQALVDDFYKSNKKDKYFYIYRILFEDEINREEFLEFFRRHTDSFSFEDISLIYKNLSKKYSIEVNELYAGLDILKSNSESIFIYTLLSYIHNEKPDERKYIDIYRELLTRDRSVNENDYDFVEMTLTHLSSVISKRGYTSKFIDKDIYIERKVPKIALCISGQLRGFRDAYSTWKNTFLKDFEVDIFVHTWNFSGFRKPVLSHCDRVFSGDFLKVYRDTLMRSSNYENIMKLYPSIEKYFSRLGYITYEELAEFYDTKFIKIENEDEDRFRDLTNIQKMYYKMSECYAMAKNIDSYDVYIRIRPDLLIDYRQKPNWSEIFENIKNGMPKIYVDHKPELTSGVKFVIGDQFAIGDERSMDIYHSVWETSHRFRNERFLGEWPLAPHSSIAYRLYYANLDVNIIDGMLFKGLANVKLNAKKVYELIKHDVSEREMTKADRVFLEALERDLKGFS